LALAIGLDRQGRIDWPSVRGSFNLGALAIDRLNLNGRVDLHDAASGGHLVLDDLVFSGDARSLATAMRGEGHFKLAGAQTPFRISTGQTPDNKGTRVRLSLDPGEPPLAADLDGVLTFEAQSPHLEGTATLARSSQNPWRISTKLKATPASASFEEMEWAYGPEDAALKLTGAGDMQFGASPKLQIKLSAQQLDADPLLAKGGRTAPVELLAKLRDLVAEIPAAPIAAQVSINADQISLGGRPVQNMSAAVRGDANGWTFDKIELSAPGTTRVNLSGTVKRSGGDARFNGPVAIDSKGSQSFQDWFLGQPLASYRYETPLAISATAAVGKDVVDLSNFKMTLDGNRLEGRVTQSKDELVAVLQSQSFDFGNSGDADGALNRLKAAGPSHAKISLDVAHATVGGQNVSPLTFDLDYRADAQTSGTTLGLAVKRADLTPWLGMALPVNGLTASLNVTGDKFSLTNIDGKPGDTEVKGSLAVTRGDDTNIDGDLALDTVDVAALTAAALGGAGRASADPLGRGWLQGWRGRIAFRSAHAILPGGTALNDPSGVLRNDGQSLYVDDLKAMLGGGTASATIKATRGESSTSASAQVQITDADGDALKYRTLALPEGKASLQMTLASEGRSLAALSNALSGNGVLTLDGARIEGLDAGAFDAAISASDGGQAGDDAKLRAIVEPLLAQGAVAVNAAQIPFDIRDGRLRVGETALDAGNARVVVSGGYDMPADQVDLRATLALPALGTPTSRPQLQIFLHGTPDSLSRTVDLSALSSWLALRAIERETQRLDQLEGRGAPSAAGGQPHSEAQPSAPVPVPAPNPRKRASVPKTAVAPVSVPPPPAPSVTADGQTLAPLPPPIDIRPAPGARPKKPRSPGPQGLPPVGTAF
ncbi:MAG: AsmA-like C-terminal region-containing protein, partial [Xanthobacteraceae bacterium]|nr:AsmA-like C-terminal region-containing protein [Xanthobacteraceae bacterium]